MVSFFRVWFNPVITGHKSGKEPSLVRPITKILICLLKPMKISILIVHVIIILEFKNRHDTDLRAITGVSGIVVASFDSITRQ